jgi:ABC-2 type transport system ATP-binding protein
MKKMLSVTELRKVYGNLIAVGGVSFEVDQNEIVGLLGPNGAGKTTTINMILGVLEPTAGSIQIEEYDIATQRRKALTRTNFAAVYAPLPGNLTVEQNLRVFGLIYNVPNISTRIQMLMQQFDLERFRTTKCGLLSSGEQTRVSLAKAFLNRPQLLLFDEPTASLDPATAEDIRIKIREFARQVSSGILWCATGYFSFPMVKYCWKGTRKRYRMNMGKNRLKSCLSPLRGNRSQLSSLNT